MIVIAIVIFLFSIAIFPYSYYMERWYVERTMDSIGQEWILAHKEVRNGKMFDTNIHANKVLIFRKERGELEQYLLSWSTIPPIGDFIASPTNPDIKADTSLVFDSRIEILDFSGSAILSSGDNTLWYFIEAPYGSWTFFTGTTPFSSTGIFLTVWYTGASIDTGRARKILLRPYLQ